MRFERAFNTAQPGSAPPPLSKAVQLQATASGHSWDVNKATGEVGVLGGSAGYSADTQRGRGTTSAAATYAQSSTPSLNTTLYMPETDLGRRSLIPSPSPPSHAGSVPGAGVTAGSPTERSSSDGYLMARSLSSSDATPAECFAYAVLPQRSPLSFLRTTLPGEDPTSVYGNRSGLTTSALEGLTQQQINQLQTLNEAQARARGHSLSSPSSATPALGLGLSSLGPVPDSSSTSPPNAQGQSQAQTQAGPMPPLPSPSSRLLALPIAVVAPLREDTPDNDTEDDELMLGGTTRKSRLERRQSATQAAAARRAYTDASASLLQPEDTDTDDEGADSTAEADQDDGELFNDTQLFGVSEAAQDDYSDSQSRSRSRASRRRRSGSTSTIASTPVVALPPPVHPKIAELQSSEQLRARQQFTPPPEKNVASSSRFAVAIECAEFLYPPSPLLLPHYPLPLRRSQPTASGSSPSLSYFSANGTSPTAGESNRTHVEKGGNAHASRGKAGAVPNSKAQEVVSGKRRKRSSSASSSGSRSDSGSGSRSSSGSKRGKKKKKSPGKKKRVKPHHTIGEAAQSPVKLVANGSHRSAYVNAAVMPPDVRAAAASSSASASAVPADAGSTDPAPASTSGPSSPAKATRLRAR